MSSTSRRKKKGAAKSAPPAPRGSSQARQPYPDSEVENGKAYSMHFPCDKHPDAASSTGEGPLEFSTPNDWDRPIQKGEGVVLPAALPWGSDVEDSRNRYPLPMFPGALSPHTGKVDWKTKEEDDFKNSVKYWVIPYTDTAANPEGIESIAEQMWQKRKQRRTLYWLHWSAARGAYLVSENEAEAAERTWFRFEEDSDGLDMFQGDEAELEDLVAFPISQERERSESSISLVIGGGTTKKGKQPQDGTRDSDRSTAGGSWRLGSKRSR